MSPETPETQTLVRRIFSLCARYVRSRTGQANIAFGSVLAVLLAVAIGAQILAMFVNLTKKPIFAVDNLQLHSLPTALPASGEPRWRTIRDDKIMSAEEVEELGSSNYVSRWYERVPRTPDEEPLLIELHCVYYTGQIDTVPHVPERCFVGNAGMQIVGAPSIVPIPLDFDELGPGYFAVDGEASSDERTVWTGRATNGRRYRLPFGIEELSMRVTPFETPDGKTKIHAGYFFLANGTTVASADQVRNQSFNLQSDYAYYTKVQFMTSGVETPEELADAAGELLDYILPDIMRRVPDWHEVEAGTYDFTDYSKNS